MAVAARTDAGARRHGVVMEPTPTLTVRNEADLLALVPFTLGFVPEDSLVVVTLGGDGRPFHARVDLPDDVLTLETVAAELVVAAVRNDAEVALVVVYTADECLAEMTDELLVPYLVAAGIRILTSIRADGHRWFPLDVGPDDPCRADGVPYDISTHPLTSQGVFEGRVLYGNRSELADSLSVVDPVLVDAVADAVADLPALGPDRSLLLAEGQWALRCTDRLLRGGVDEVASCPPEELARLLRALSDPDIRDLVWNEITRPTAPAYVVLWRELVRRSPEHAVAPPAGLLAFSAWLAGNGALAWCAVDRALEADPDHRLAQLVAETLESALPPSRWRPMDPSALTLFAG